MTGNVGTIDINRCGPHRNSQELLSNNSDEAATGSPLAMVVGRIEYCGKKKAWYTHRQCQKRWNHRLQQVWDTKEKELPSNNSTPWDHRPHGAPTPLP